MADSTLNLATQDQRLSQPVKAIDLGDSTYGLATVLVDRNGHAVLMDAAGNVPVAQGAFTAAQDAIRTWNCVDKIAALLHVDTTATSGTTLLSYTVPAGLSGFIVSRFHFYNSTPTTWPSVQILQTTGGVTAVRYNLISTETTYKEVNGFQAALQAGDTWQWFLTTKSSDATLLLTVGFGVQQQPA